MAYQEPGSFPYLHGVGAGFSEARASGIETWCLGSCSEASANPVKLDPSPLAGAGQGEQSPRTLLASKSPQHRKLKSRQCSLSDLKE